MSAPTVATDPSRLYSAPRHPIVVEVPELPLVAIDGSGGPEGEEFQAAVRALYSVTYGIHFALTRRDGTAPHVRPLEALWWSEDPAQFDTVMGIRGGTVNGFAEADRASWSWTAMITQPDAIDLDLVERVTAEAGRTRALPALRWLRFSRWCEGSCVQVMHVGPYSEEPATVALMHEFIAERALRPVGRHHEIYLGDPRRCAPERLRTILRQPVEPSV